MRKLIFLTGLCLMTFLSVQILPDKKADTIAMHHLQDDLAQSADVLTVAIAKTSEFTSKDIQGAIYQDDLNLRHFKESGIETRITDYGNQISNDRLNSNKAPDTCQSLLLGTEVFRMRPCHKVIA